MCRFFGTLRSSNIEKIPDQQFKEIVKISTPGGPDATEYYSDEIADFGFNRLSILDTTEKGNQPIIAPSGRYVIMLNGEVYNFKKLTQKYGLNYLRSGSDAEVVTQLIDKIGFYNSLQELDGMFGISVWDRSSKKLFLARDFAGIKPLFFASTPKGFVFGSQFDQILHHPWLKPFEFSFIGLREYLQFGYMSAPYTIAKFVKQLLPGECVEFDVHSLEIKLKKYLSFYQSKVTNLKETNQNTIEQVKNTLIDSVEEQLVADVPLGVFLSGGIDSSLVTSIASKIRPDIQSITVGFEQKQHDESEKAKEYAKILGVRNKNIILSEKELLNLYENHFKLMPEPLADYSSLPTFLISKIAVQDFKVMLSGDGGDELFWGYPRFKTYANSTFLFSIKNTFLRQSAGKIYKKLGKDITSFYASESIGKVNYHFHSYLNESIFKNSGLENNLSEQTVKGYFHQSTSKIDTLLHLRENEFYFHLQKILVKVDRASMGNALEVRVPLLSKEMIQLSEQISPELTLKHQDLKLILKQILAQYLPKEIIEKTKKGFNPPLVVWSKTVLKEEILDVVKSTKLEVLGDLQPKLQNYVEDYMNNKHNNLTGIWTYYVLCKWLKNNNL